MTNELTSYEKATQRRTLNKRTKIRAQILEAQQKGNWREVTELKKKLRKGQAIAAGLRGASLYQGRSNIDKW